MNSLREKFGIEPAYEAFYIESMLFCSISALNSLETITDWINSLSGKVVNNWFEEYHEDQILDNLQNVIIQGAALSRYFWPSRQGSTNEHKLRGEHLRKAFEITEKNPLKERDLRNELEHFDERLDIYLTYGIVGNIIPKYIGPLPEKSNIPIHIFRAYYTDVAIFEILGKRYFIKPLSDEIIRIHQLLEKFIQSGYKMVTK